MQFWTKTPSNETERQPLIINELRLYFEKLTFRNASSPQRRPVITFLKSASFAAIYGGQTGHYLYLIRVESSHF